MNRSKLTTDLITAEGLLLEDRNDEALTLLAQLAEDAEEYVARNCVTTDMVQWFSFPTMFEFLAYKKVEDDPREIRDIDEPLDRLYADLALAYVRTGDYALATEALKQAVRWNPMGCGYRLDLADLFATNGNMDEYLGLTYSVFERASDVRHLVRAYCNFADFFESTGREMLCAAALRCARRFEVADKHLDAALTKAKDTTHDPDIIDDKEASKLLASEGLPDGANAEIAICMLMCATDAADVGAKDLATNLVIRARDLVGQPAVAALLELIRTDETNKA